MSTRTTRRRLVAGGVALLMLGGIGLAPARANRPSLVEALLGRYIVTLRDSVADPGAVAGRQTGLLGGTVDQVFSSALKGYTVSLPAALLSSLLGDPSVKAVEPDTRLALAATQANPPYGLDRIDQRSLPLSRSYTYASGAAGVRAYVIDTGTKADHPEFLGRVTTGYNALDGSTDTRDCLGHGTHVAGILAGSTYGVAKGVTIVPVKAFGCTQSTPLSALIAAVDWATADHRPGQPAVANLSLTGIVSAALDRAVTALSNDGAGFSNGGPCVDLFAPGARILSTDNRSTGPVPLSGTSMASPLVAGPLALEMGMPGTTAQQAPYRVLVRATSGMIKGTEPRCAGPSACRPATQANRLLFTG